MVNGVWVSRSAMGMVTRMRCDERSSALLQFGRLGRGATESRSWAPLASCPDLSFAISQREGFASLTKRGSPCAATLFGQRPRAMRVF
ncbi:MAG: hypothetical protein QOG14_2351 [Mycobacterium sp.]|jgi:hypothetical protein|nr:hypothetical protein [Mycobacterium sp.]